MDNVVPGNTLGALEIGVLVSYMLFGVTTTQTYIYYHRFPDDPLKLKALVAFVLVCESGHAICMGNVLYTYTIIDYGHAERLAYAVPKSLLGGGFVSAVISTSVQGFFTLRMHVLTKKPYLCLIISGMVFLSSSGSQRRIFPGVENDFAGLLRGAVGVAVYCGIGHQRYNRLNNCRDPHRFTP
ncbi:hypothetical protein MSAN_00208500 [Mycena sanguinolenta]|uniref:Uncharacterized protein n=1 Tax=Mycena sanguinolenta TaxID=230812 RepID=A0A8H6ZF51_9AGAR|nr:hypothetical protein MSAN_00208500 [Mycena sanguinolenta]